MPPIELPDDIESLKRLVIEAQTALAQAESVLRTREREIEHLRLTLARLRRLSFGRSSEQLDARIAQLQLTLEDLETTAATLPPPGPRPRARCAGLCPNISRARRTCMRR